MVSGHISTIAICDVCLILVPTAATCCMPASLPSHVSMIDVFRSTYEVQHVSKLVVPKHRARLLLLAS